MAKMIFGSLINEFPELSQVDYKTMPISEILCSLGYKFVNEEEIDYKYINADDYENEEIVPLPVNEKPKVTSPVVKKEDVAPVPPVAKKDNVPTTVVKKEEKKKDSKVNYQISINKKSEREDGSKEHKSIDVSVDDKPISEEMLKDILMKIDSSDNMTEELANKIKMAAEKYAENPLNNVAKMELLKLTEELEEKKEIMSAEEDYSIENFKKELLNYAKEYFGAYEDFNEDTMKQQIDKEIKEIENTGKIIEITLDGIMTVDDKVVMGTLLFQGDKDYIPFDVWFDYDKEEGYYISIHVDKGGEIERPIKDETETSNKDIKSFAEAYHILQEDKPNNPKYWDIYKTEKGYSVYRQGVSGSEGFAGDFNASDMEKLFTPDWKDNVGEYVDEENIASSIKIKAKYFNELPQEIQEAIFNGIKKDIEEDINGYFTEDDIKDFESGKLDKEDVVNQLVDHQINVSNSHDEIREMINQYYLDADVLETSKLPFSEEDSEIEGSAKSKYNKIMKEKSTEELEKELSTLKEKRVDSELETETIKDKIKVLDKLLNKPAEETKKEEKEMKQEVKEEKKEDKGEDKEDKKNDRIEKLNEDPDEPSEQDLMAKEEYKTDKDIEKEFEGYKIDELEWVPKKEGNDWRSGKLVVSFPEGEEHVGGGSTQVVEYFMIDDKGRVLFDNWFPEKTGIALRDYIKKNIDKDIKASINKIESADKYEMPKKEGSKYIDLREVFDTDKKAEARIKAIEKGKKYIVVHYTKYTSVEGNEVKSWFEIEAKPIEVKEMDTKSTVEDTNKAHEIVKVPENIYKLDKEADKLSKVEDMTNKKLPTPTDDTAKALKKPKDETAETIEQIGIKASEKEIFDILTKTNKEITADTYISFRQDISKIKNLNEMPTEVQNEIKSADYIESRGFQELLGYKEEGKIIWSLGGHWTDETGKDFVGINFGSKNIQWDGEKVTPTNNNEDIKSAEKIVAKQNEINVMTQDIENLLMAFYDHDESASGKIAKKNIKSRIEELNKKIEALKIEIKSDDNATKMLTEVPKAEAPKEGSDENVPSLTPDKVEPTDKNVGKEGDNISDSGLALGQGFILHKDNESNELYVIDKQGTEVVRVPNLIKDDSASKIEFFTKLLNLTPAENKAEVKEDDNNKGNESDRLDKIEKKVDELLNIEKGEKEQMTAEEKISQKQNEELAVLKKDIETKKPQIAKIIQSLIDNNKISITREDIRAYIIKGEDPIFAKKKVKEDKLKSLNKKLWAMDNDTLKVLFSVFCDGKKEIKSSGNKNDGNDISEFLMFLNS